VDTPEKPRRPSWKRGRWWAVAVVLLLWLSVAYPLSRGPLSYCAVRGWIGFGYSRFFRLADIYFAPFGIVSKGEPDPPAPWALFPPGHPVNKWYWRDYFGWWGDLASEHNSTVWKRQHPAASD
jgi:hypothetical protein